jgi:hypothetical protein
MIDENNIWAVGVIFMNDSTGQPDPQPYCIAKWNGQKWSLEKFSFNLYNYNCTIAGSYYGTAEAVYSFDDNVIIFTDGADFVKLDGDTYSHLPCTINLLNGSVRKIWGNSSNDFYALGTIIHYNGSTWQKIESGTTTNLNDIWGYYNKTNSNLSILTVASNILQPGETRLLAISSGIAADTLNWPYTNWLKGVWFKGKYSPLYICGGGVKEYKQGQWNQLNLPNYFTEGIRGNDLNDVTAVGDFGFITHFNGVRWYSANISTDEVFTSVAIKNNTVAIAGYSTSGFVGKNAVVVIGRR